MERTEYTKEALSGLPRAELRRMLAAELHKDIPQIDDNLVRLLLAELRSRGCDPDLPDDEAVTLACENFRANKKAIQKPGKSRYPRWMAIAAAVLLVLGILFFALPGAAQADDLPEVLGWWSDSVFQFIQPGQKPNIEEYVYETDHPGLQQLYDAVSKLGITEPIVPRWIPDGFALNTLKQYQMDGYSAIHTCFVSNDKTILFTIDISNDNTSFQHEKDIDHAKIWDLNGIEHYIISNNSTWIITWIKSGIECSITADCPEEDVYKIIKSIYTSED